MAASGVANAYFWRPSLTSIGKRTFSSASRFTASNAVGLRRRFD
jgi:hypothetical protein